MPSDTSNVLRIVSFRHFLSSRALSSMAFQGSAVAIGWLIYDRTRNPFDLGLVGLFQFLPMLVLTFVAGHVADQFDRRQIGLICQVVEALTMGFIALGVWQGWLPTWGVFAAVAVLGAAQAFERPTMAALLPGIVPTAQLQSAVATSTSVMQTALIIGPALGGVLYGFGEVVPFLVSGAAVPRCELQRAGDRKAGIIAAAHPDYLRSRCSPALCSSRASR